jgi:amidophosphoribosyltransferase
MFFGQHTKSQLSGGNDMCGINGVIKGESTDLHLPSLGVNATKGTQHRGEENTGIVISSATDFCMRKGTGWVSEVFSHKRPEWDDICAVEDPQMIMGHTRYSTAGGSDVANAQPHVLTTHHGHWALGSNGDIPGYQSLREEMVSRGVVFQSQNDAELILLWLANHADGQPKGIEAAIRAFMLQVNATYSAILMARDRMFIFRDPWGNRPLCIGTLDGATIFASETCVLTRVGAKFVRDVEPGELIIASPDGIQEASVVCRAEKLSRCLFEYIYFSRPDSIFDGLPIAGYRVRCGQRLADEKPVPDSVQFVSSVPKSGDLATEGFALASGLPARTVWLHDPYKGRTFIQPDQILREDGARVKYSLLPESFDEWDCYAQTDDSIVRGTTQRRLVQVAHDGGAREAHVRVASPAYINRCRMGIDTPDTYDLFASPFVKDGQVDERAAANNLGADSLSYLSLEGAKNCLQKADGSWPVKPEDVCTHCFDGRNPFCETCPCS